ncbi:MAG: DUF4062 domain-containing protein [Sulfitobacter sp.]
MSEKKYQVFISSTFEDLQTERSAVQDTIIQMGDFPVQMESFPAADEGQLEFIKSLIDQCDYYILIIGGRYGSIGPDGMSYTHKEYRYAVEKGVPVLVVVHENADDITGGKSEKTQTGRKKLEGFIAEATKERLRTTWSSAEQLKLRVREALDHAKATKVRSGWVRGDTIASVEVLEELNFLRKQNDKYRSAIDSLEIEITLPPLPDVRSELLIDFLPVQYSEGYDTPDRIGEGGTIATTWLSGFPVFYSNLVWDSDNFESEYYIDRERTSLAIGSSLVQEIADRDVTEQYKISLGTLEKLAAYYIEAGLMNNEEAGVPFTDLAQKLARRHRLTETEYPHFVLRSGTLKTTAVSKKRDLEDEIPF